jgi:predicted permease
MSSPSFSHPVITSLLPVILLIAAGYVAGKQGWIRASAKNDYSNLVFFLLLPPLLFRTMANTHPENLQLLPVFAYLGSMVILFAPAASALQALWGAARQPTTWPIILGLLYSQTNLGIPIVIDRPLQLLGQAFSPLALVLVGLTLSVTQFGDHIKPALGLSVLKNFVQPLLVLGLGLGLGLHGLPLTVMVVAASLPMGANVFMFSQRYQESEDLVTTSVSISTVMALFSVALTMSLAPLIDRL